MSRKVWPEAAPVSVAALWAEHDNQHLDWAFRAYERFVVALSPEISERLIGHKGPQEEAYVVVFGKTQVGKTTLLMDLMGVMPSSLERVSKALRGGRAQGQSATATTMEYRRSADRRWGLRITDADTRWFDDDRGIAAALGQLRTAMECGQLVVHSPCVVYIPADCFPLQVGQLAVRMLDLPGDKPANSTEQEHVEEMARKYVPLADLILLVGKGDDLSFLQPGGLTLPGIDDWQSVPGRFRIVTTFSFTAQSVRNLVRQHDGLAEASFYRERLIAQIEKFGSLGRDARRPERYFPLEFGVTWLDAKQRQPELYARISPMIDELKGQLHADIQASTTPLARLRNAVDAHVVIARVKESRLKEMECKTLRVKEKLEQTQKDQSLAEVAVERFKKESELLMQRVAGLSDERLSRDLKDYFKLSGETSCGDPCESVAGFKSLVRRAKESLKQRLADSRPDSVALVDTSWFWRDVKAEIDPRQVDDILNKAFSNFVAKLEDYLIDEYWLTHEGSDYERDRSRLKRCIDDAAKVLTELSRAFWLKAASEQRSKLQKEAQDTRLVQRSWEQMVADKAREIAHLEQELAAHVEEDRKFQQRMEKDLQESRRFIELLDTEYLCELQRRRNAIQSKGPSIPAFLELLATVRLAQEREKLRIHIQPNQAI